MRIDRHAFQCFRHFIWVLTKEQSLQNFLAEMGLQTLSYPKALLLQSHHPLLFVPFSGRRSSSFWSGRKETAFETPSSSHSEMTRDPREVSKRPRVHLRDYFRMATRKLAHEPNAPLESSLFIRLLCHRGLIPALS